MIDYLKKYNLTDEDINEIKTVFNKDIINNFEIMMDNVCLILDELFSIGVNNIKHMILIRPDICFSDLESLKEKINKFDKNLIKYVIENDPNNLINFDT